MFQVRRDSEAVLAWSGDPFFRPTIGAFVDGRLVATAPTVRRRVVGQDGTPAWICRYPRKRLLAAGGGRAVLVCLESGEVLREVGEKQARAQLAGSMPDRDSASTSSIDDLIAIGTQRQQPWAASGFFSLLKLSPIDQVQLVFIDVMGRPADSEAIANYIANMEKRNRTILDVRDAVLASDEFKRRDIGPNDRVGKWLVWTGLDACAPALLLPGGGAGGANAQMPSSFRSGLAGLRSVEGLADRLARLALGRNPPAAATGQWKADHRAMVADLARQLDLGPTGASRGSTSDAPVTFGNLLVSMTPEQAGRRVGRAIRSVRGRPGAIAAGPLMRLAAGRYNLRVSAHAVEAGAASGPLAIEIAYGTEVLARRDFPADSLAADAACEVPFVIAGPLARRLSGAGFEFRLSTNGTSEIEIDAMSLRREASISDDGDRSGPEAGRGRGVVQVLADGVSRLREAVGAR